MQTEKYTLGIDTSNYTTSVALTRCGGEIIHDLRKPLTVKRGERGLRQSHALFQHVEALPDLLKEALGGKGGEIGAVSVSVRPRPQALSYMPVFKAGESFAKAVSYALDIPVFEFSHQEGHIEAVKNYSSMKSKGDFLCWHLSGGTCELLKVKGNSIEIIGGTKDISFGQLLDRIGVCLGLPFPCGAKLDEISAEAGDASDFLKEIPADGLQINLSGIETQAARVIAGGLSSKSENALVKEIFNKIYNSLVKVTERAVFETKLTDVLFTGGVSSSRCLHEALRGYFDGSGTVVDFGDRRLSSDNAVGIALLGGKSLWL